MWFLNIYLFVGIPFFIAKLPNDNTAGVFPRTFFVKNMSNSLTYTIVSSCVCTSSLTVLTIVGLHDFVKASISASLRSFLLIMCIDAPESTTNSLSSSFNVDAGRHLFSGDEKNVAFFMLLQFEHIFGQLPRCFAGTLLLPLCLFLWCPILKFWSIGATLMRFTWTNTLSDGFVSNFSMTFAMPMGWTRTPVLDGWVQIVRGPRPKAVQWPLQDRFGSLKRNQSVFRMWWPPKPARKSNDWKHMLFHCWRFCGLHELGPKCSLWASGSMRARSSSREPRSV